MGWYQSLRNTMDSLMGIGRQQQPSRDSQADNALRAYQTALLQANAVVTQAGIGVKAVEQGAANAAGVFESDSRSVRDAASDALRGMSNASFVDHIKPGDYAAKHTDPEGAIKDAQAQLEHIKQAIERYQQVENIGTYHLRGIGASDTAAMRGELSSPYREAAHTIESQGSKVIAEANQQLNALNLDALRQQAIEACANRPEGAMLTGLFSQHSQTTGTLASLQDALDTQAGNYMAKHDEFRSEAKDAHHYKHWGREQVENLRSAARAVSRALESDFGVRIGEMPKPAQSQPEHPTTAPATAGLIR